MFALECVLNKNLNRSILGFHKDHILVLNFAFCMLKLRQTERHDLCKRINDMVRHVFNQMEGIIYILFLIPPLR